MTQKNNATRDPGALDDEPEIATVTIRLLPDAGPFWERGVHISDSPEELHRWLRVSRQTYDDTMAWRARALQSSEADLPDMERQRQSLLDRLRSEVAPAVVVDDGTPVDRVIVHLVDLVLVDGRIQTKDGRVMIGAVEVKELGLGFLDDLVVWRSLYQQMQGGRLPDRRIPEVEDLGTELANQLQSHLIGSYHVVSWA
jgi:hypothetical protein